MVNNVAAPSGDGAGANFASDDVGGVHYPVCKLAFGVDDTATWVSSSNPFPVTAVNGGTFAVQVDNNPVLGAGTNAIGKLAANSGVDIGDVDVLSLPGSLTGYSEDAVTPATIVGIPGMMERDDIIGTLTPAEGDWAAFRCSAEGALWVQDFNSDAILAALGGTLTISGTVTANLGATDNQVLNNIQTSVDALAAIISGGAFLVDGSGVTQPVSAASLPLPSGAATAANQSTGNSALAAIQTAAELSDDVVYVDDADWTALTSRHALVGGLYQSSPGTVTDGDVGPFRMDSNGRIIVSPGTALDVSAATVTVDGSGVTQPVSHAALTELAAAINTNRVDVNIAADGVGIGGGTQYTEDDAAAANPVGTMPVLVRADTPAGVTSANGDVVAQRATDYGAAFVQVLDSSGNFIDTFGGSGGTATTDDGAFTAGTGQGTPIMGFFSTDVVDAGDVGVLAMDASRRLFVSLEVDNVGLALETGGNLATIAGAVSGTEMQVDIVGALPAGTNAIGKLAANSGVDIGDVDVTSIAAGSNLIGDVGISGARTSGGTTPFRSIDVDESSDQIKSSGGQLYWIHAINLASSVRYLKVYNHASPTVGTTTPVLTFPVPTQGDTNGAGFVFSVPNGVAFDTGISIAATTALADADTGAPGANEVIVNAGYA